MRNLQDGADSGTELSKRAVKSGLARTGVVYLIGCLLTPLLVVIVFGGVFLLNSYIKNNPVNPDSAMPIVFVAVFIVMFGALYAVMAIVAFRRKLVLDRVFVPLGLSGSFHNLFFRRYQGMIGGRRVEIIFARGPVVEILIETNLRTRLGVSLNYPDTVIFADLANLPPLRPNSPNLQGLMFWAHEERWAANLISLPQSEALFHRMLLGESAFVRRHLKIQPTLMQLHFSGNANVFKIDLTEALVRQWLSDAIELLSIAETRIAPPAVPIDMTPAEATALRWRRKNLTVVLLFVYLGLPLFFLLTVGLIMFILRS